MRLLLAAAALAIAATPAQAAFTDTAGNRANTARAAAVFKPKLVAPPEVTGKLERKQTLTGFDGRWERQPATVTRAWLRCDGSGESCAEISGATGVTYKLVADDVDKRLRLRVTAVNPGGEVTVRSVATETVRQAPQLHPPVNLAAPTISGTVRVDELLSARVGDWAGEEITFGYQWLRCTSASNCTDLAGETRATYRPDSSDVGKLVRVRVTATNETASAVAIASPTAAIGRSTYTYVACANPDTGKGVWGAGLPPGFNRAQDPSFSYGVIDRCGVGETKPMMHTWITGGATHTPWTATRLRYYVPNGVTLVGGELYRATGFASPMGYAFTTGPDGPAYPGAWSEGSHNHGQYGAGDPNASPFATVNRLWISEATPAGFGFTLHCHTNGGYCAGSGWQSLYGGKFTLRDMTAPTSETAPTGTLASGAVGRSATLGVDLRDAQTGLYRVRVYVDDVQVAIKNLANGTTPHCTDVNPGNGDEYEFASHTPCPTAYTSTLSFDTTSWGTGTRQVHVVAEDVGHNTVTLVKRAVTLTNAVLQG